MKQDELAISVQDLTKKFKIYYDKGNQLKERLLFRKRSRYEERTVLNGISFQVKKRGGSRSDRTQRLRKKYHAEAFDEDYVSGRRKHYHERTGVQPD